MAIEERFQVISTRLLAGRTIVHVFADSSPGAEFEPVEADMKDVYFSVMSRRRRAASGAGGAGGAGGAAA
jgi:hypothetical protein